MRHRSTSPLVPESAVVLLALGGILLAPGTAEADRDFQLLWHGHRSEAMYTSVGVCDGAWVFAGGGEDVWAPTVVECYDIWGPGAPAWAHAGSGFHVDASRGSTVLAGIEFDAADSSVTVKAWHPDSPTPLWSYRVHPCQPLGCAGWTQGKGIQVSDDGSAIAVLPIMYSPEGMHGRLHVFEPAQSDPSFVFDLPHGGASALAVTPDGSFIAICARPYVHVFDRAAGALRWRGPAGPTSDAIAISGDGRYLAWGYSTFTLREWNGTDYQQIWSTAYGGAYVLSECALTPGGEMLALAWSEGTTYEDTIIELYALPGVTPIWSYSYADEQRKAGRPAMSTDGRRTPIDVPSEMLFAGDDILAVSSWGGAFPEIHVFERAQPVPLLVYDTPGSMFDIDIMQTADATYLTACGIDVQYGQSSGGGDLYTFASLGGGAVPNDSGVGRSAALRLSNEPNPFRGQTTLRYRLNAPGKVRLTVHDLQGRQIATLFDAVADRGEHSAVWTGRDAAGQPMSPGVYLLRLLGADGANSRLPVVLLEAR